MTDYKQLCADLVAWAEKTSAHYYSEPGILIQARAALAEPEPPSLKERALQALANADGADHPVVTTVLTADQHALIRKALEQLND